MTSYPKEKIKILLLEGVHADGKAHLEQSGYKVELRKDAMTESELIDAIQDVHILGIRSKTEVTEKVLQNAKSLLSVGCFCIGTNQVSLKNAAIKGIPVFNAPFSNTRSVAELAMAEIVMLARKAAHKSNLLHNGVWEKSAVSCYEVRNKALGIIGYGHIGPQIGLLAESFGMKVYYYDIMSKLALGNANSVKSLEELLKISDFVSLHVPETPQTKGMIGERELSLMQKGSYLLNLSRGTVVDIDALAEKLKSGHIAGAAIDVFPYEPKSNSEKFVSPLQGLDNVILTPHLGGSTDEAQRNIGIEVAGSLLKFLEQGTTTGSVNFPRVELPIVHNSHRILNIHHNVPGVLKEINSIMADIGANITGQYLSTMDEVGYMIVDVDKELSGAVKDKIEQLPTSIRTRLLF